MLPISVTSSVAPQARFSEGERCDQRNQGQHLKGIQRWDILDFLNDWELLGVDEDRPGVENIFEYTGHPNQ